jgi:outer membrane lipoprotein SlyB
MNRSTLIGVVAGIGLATAGGIAAYTFLGEDAEVGEQASATECWDEEVAVQTDPVDPHRIAGTAGGAIVGGAIGKDLGDRDITTAAGAAAGALIGRKIEEEIQENRAEQRTTTTIERRCAPVGSP